MLKYFDRDGKMNWVDSNNVFVGFDDEGSCCEVWGAGFYDSLDGFTQAVDIDLTVDNNWVFDTTFYVTDAYYDFIDRSSEAVCAAFRLVDGDKAIYLVIWNDHNGYYAHGFNFCNGDTVIVEGAL